MTHPARRARSRGAGEYRDEAERLLEAPGDLALVRRGRVRSLLISCPDACGDTLVINLDARAGKAWRLDERRGTTTLYPSVWREDGCRSHFILWRDHIVWCGRYEADDEPAYDPALEDSVLNALDADPRAAWEIGDAIDELAWDVARVLRRLSAAGLATEGKGKRRGLYSRAEHPDAQRR